MRPDERAVIFDLDDTLYPYRRFQVSGFAAAARHLESRTGLDRRLGFRAMHGASRGTWRTQEIQACLVQYELSLSLVPELVEVLRYHEPRLRLSSVVRRVLAGLRADGWRLGVLTNGSPSIQARKVDALGIRPLVDAVVFAAQCGAGFGKPDTEAFGEAARALGTSASHSIVIGNDELADVGGAAAAGMRSVSCQTWVRPAEDTRAQAVVRRFGDIPMILRRFVQEDSARHAA